jgi:hypothetical protein
MLALITASILLVSLSACGGGNEPPNSAVSTPAQSSGPTTAESQTPTDEPWFAEIKNATVGDRVFMGTREGEPIKWQVLDKSDDYAVLISQFVLERRVWANAADSTWMTCELRAYLNTQFLGAFSQEEIAKIDRVNESLVYLLSVEEAKQYFADDTARTAYIYGEDAAGWWLVTQGMDSTHVAYVQMTGAINTDGADFTLESGVRPVIRVNLT